MVATNGWDTFCTSKLGKTFPFKRLPSSCPPVAGALTSKFPTEVAHDSLADIQESSVSDGVVYVDVACLICTEGRDAPHDCNQTNSNPALFEPILLSAQTLAAVDPGSHFKSTCKV